MAEDIRSFLDKMEVGINQAVSAAAEAEGLGLEIPYEPIVLLGLRTISASIEATKRPTLATEAASRQLSQDLLSALHSDLNGGQG